MAEKDKLLKEQFTENLRDSMLRRDIKRWSRDHPESTFQDVRLEVHRYIEEEPTSRRSAAVREAVVEEEEAKCGEITDQRSNPKIFTELISGQKVLAEEIQRQQKVLMSHIEQQQKVLNRQQETLNQLLTTMATRSYASCCYRCGQDGHFAHECPKGTSGSPARNKQRRPPKKERSGNEKPPPQ